MREKKWKEIDPEKRRTIPPQWRKIEVEAKSGFKFFAVRSKDKCRLLSKKFNHIEELRNIRRWRMCDQDGFDSIDWFEEFN